MEKVNRSSVENFARDIQRLEEAVIPPSVRMMRDISRSARQTHRLGVSNPIAELVESMRKPGVLSQLTGSSHLSLHGLASAVAQPTPIVGTLRSDTLSSLRANLESAGIDKGSLDGSQPIYSLLQNISKAGLRNELLNTPYLDLLGGVGVLDRQMKSLRFDGSAAAWTNHVRELALPSMFALSDLGRHLGMLTALPGAGCASLLWETRNKKWVAGMFEATDPTEHAAIEVEGVVVCAFCNDQMITAKTKFDWVGPRRGVTVTEVVPFCVRCMSQNREEQGFLLRSIDKFEKGLPSLSVRVLDGDGEGDGIRRGQLQLVHNKIDGDAPE